MPQHLYMECTKRVKAKGFGECSPWYFDYFHALDHCVSASPTPHPSRRSLAGLLHARNPVLRRAGLPESRRLSAGAE